MWMSRNAKRCETSHDRRIRWRTFVAISMLYGQNLRKRLRFSPNRERCGRDGAEDPAERSREPGSRSTRTAFMSRHPSLAPLTVARVAVLALGTALAAHSALAAPNFPITSEQRSTAQRVASSGIPVGELNADAPDVYTVKTRDTLWDISKMYLKSPWRWARALGHEPRRGAQPAPDLPRPAALPREVRRPAPACAWAAAPATTAR